LLILCFACNGFAASYYIDYAGGADTNNGTATTTAFQHCPGDANATGAAASTVLAAGDFVYFKKGVTYLGQMVISRSGSESDSGNNGTVTVDGVFTSADKTFLPRSTRGM
jgi:hypothetical protein